MSALESALAFYKRIKMKADKLQLIEQWLNERLTDTGYFLYGIKYNAAVNKVTVFVDGDQGVNIDYCAKLSREIEKFIDENNVLGEKYGLDVSSPGIDQPLVPRQFAHNIGREIAVLMNDGKELKGELKGNDATHFEISTKIKNKEIKKMEEIQHKIAFADTKKTMVIIKF